jgi:hypothetical protein
LAARIAGRTRRRIARRLFFRRIGDTGTAGPPCPYGPLIHLLTLSLIGEALTLKDGEEEYGARRTPIWHSDGGHPTARVPDADALHAEGKDPP